MTRRHTLAAKAAEEALSAALLGARKDAYPLVDEHVRANDFWDPSFAALFTALGHLHARGLAVSIPSVVGAAVESTSVTLPTTDLERLAKKSPEHVSDADLISYCKTISEFAQRRSVKAACEAGLTAIVDKGLTPAEVIDELQRRILDTGDSSTYDPDEGAQLARRVFDNAKKLAELGGFPGIHTGFQSLDKAILGHRPGKVLVVAARPGMGKSSLLKDLALAVGRTESYGCGIFNREMENEETIQRYMSGEAQVSYRKLITGRLDPQEWSRLASAVERFPTNSVLMDQAARTMPEIRRRARAIKSRLERAGRKLAFIGIDYIQLIEGRGDNRETVVSSISRDIKLMAKELGCQVVALAQLNRSIESPLRKDKRPVLSDLRESGSIEQDADTVLFVYRHSEYAKGASSTDAEFIIRKNRDGPRGTLAVGWDPKTMRFFDRDH